MHRITSPTRSESSSDRSRPVSRPRRRRGNQTQLLPDIGGEIRDHAVDLGLPVVPVVDADGREAVGDILRTQRRHPDLEGPGVDQCERLQRRALDDSRSASPHRSAPGSALPAATQSLVLFRISCGAKTNGSMRSHCGPHGGAIASML